MPVMTTAGSTFGVSAVLPGTYNAAGFNALTFTTVGEVTDMGEVGSEYSIVNHNPISARRVQKLKGSYDAGSITLQFGRDYTDAGQTAMQTALSSDSAVALRVTLQNGKKLYFTGLVTSFKTSVGSVDQVTSASAVVELVGDVLEV